MVKIRLTFILVLFLLTNSNNIISQIKIGVALPLMLSSENAEDKVMGESILLGINDALKEYNTFNTTNMVSIVIEDTKRNQEEALQIFNKFGSDSTVIGILGPVFSSELANNVGAALFHKIPIVSPTATQNFLAKNNPYVFQLNPAYDTRGRIMGDFASKDLKLNNFVIFSELSYGSNFADSFTDQIEKNGGNIVATKYYSKDNTDLTEDFKELKNELLRNDKFIDFGNLSETQSEKLKGMDFQYKSFDELSDNRSVVSIFRLFGKRAQRMVDSLNLRVIQNVTDVESQNYVTGYADAIYIPVSSPFEIPKIVSGYSSVGFELPILGTSDWNNATVLDENKSYIKDLYFDSDFYLTEKTKDDHSKSETEIRNYYFGYDAMKLILTKISEGINSRSSLNESLEKVKDYRGRHCSYTIKDRSNHQMTIMRYTNGNLMMVRDYVY